MLSIPDMALLGAAALMIFGPDQLPKVARKVGIFMRDVQNTSHEFVREMERAADEQIAAERLPSSEDYFAAPSNGAAYGSAAQGAAPGSDGAGSESESAAQQSEPSVPRPPRDYELPP